MMTVLNPSEDSQNQFLLKSASTPHKEKMQECFSYSFISLNAYHSVWHTVGLKHFKNEQSVLSTVLHLYIVQPSTWTLAILTYVAYLYGYFTFLFLFLKIDSCSVTHAAVQWHNYRSL